MTNMYDISSLSYQPSTNMEWFTKALFGGRLIENGKIDVVTGVKESTMLNLINFQDSLLREDNKNCA